MLLLLLLLLLVEEDDDDDVGAAAAAVAASSSLIHTNMPYTHTLLLWQYSADQLLRHRYNENYTL